MMRRSVLTLFLSSNLIPAAGCLSNSGHPADGSDSENVEPEEVLHVSDDAFRRGQDGVPDFGPSIHHVISQSPAVFAFVIETQDDLDWLTKDASLADLPVEESFVASTDFPTEQLVQIDVAVPETGYASTVTDLDISDTTATVSVDVGRESGGADVPSFYRHLVRAEVERGDLNEFVVERNDTTTAAESLSKYR